MHIEQKPGRCPRTMDAPDGRWRGPFRVAGQGEILW